MSPPTEIIVIAVGALSETFGGVELLISHQLFWRRCRLILSALWQFLRLKAKKLFGTWLLLDNGQVRNYEFLVWDWDLALKHDDWCRVTIIYVLNSAARCFVFGL